MNISLGISALVCRSTQAAVSLAEKNPAKYSSFANKLISGKNSQVTSSLAKAKNEFEKNKLSVSELSEVGKIKSGSLGSSAGASKASSSLMERHQDHVECMREVNRLQVKEVKYTNQINALATVGDKELRGWGQKNTSGLY